MTQGTKSETNQDKNIMDLITHGLSFKTSDSSGNVCAYVYQIPKFFLCLCFITSKYKMTCDIVKQSCGLEIEKHEMKIKTTS